MNSLQNRYIKNAEFLQPFSAFMVIVVKHIELKTVLPDDLYDSLTVALDRMQKSLADSGYPESAIKAGLLAVCAWADEEIMNAEWHGVSDVWSTILLQKKFFNTNLGGELFFEKLNSLFGDAIIAQDIFALCLAQGFKGKYALNLDLKNLELKKDEAIEKSLAYTGLSNPNHDTFATLEYFATDPQPPGINQRVLVTVLVTGFAILALTLIAYHLLSDQATALLKTLG
jgi:type IV/VI secretion system ImpK/VasF family protein